MSSDNYLQSNIASATITAVSESTNGVETITLNFVPKHFICIGGGYVPDNTTRFMFVDLQKGRGYYVCAATVSGPFAFDTDEGTNISLYLMKYTIGSNEVTFSQANGTARYWLIYE